VVQKIVIVGATSAMAEHCARLWVAESPKNLILLGRDQARTERVAQDLRVRNPQSSITVNTTDFMDPVRIREWVDHVCTEGVPDIVLIAHGSLPDQKECQQDLVMNQDVLQLNGISPVLFAEAFAGHMEKANKGKLAIIGSVAGDRGRKSNYVYGSAKGLVTRYAQGLQHRLAKTAVHVILIKPGPTETPMTAHLKGEGKKLAPPDTVAKAIWRGINNNKEIIYAPAKWEIIMMIIRHIPMFFFKKMDI
jgi:decaprenylphospho-beta-D-erythro-pentofuranosid-2-ulose 2-reductase